MAPKHPLILYVPEPSGGPAFDQLTEMQKRFVCAMLETGGQNDAEAARLAGYSDVGDCAKVRAYKLLRNPLILAAIREESEKRIQAGVGLGASVLVEIARDPLHKDRLKAAESLLNRGGLQIVTKHEITHKDERSTPELEAAVIEMARRLGVDPVKLLGYDPATVQDAEFTEVQDDLSDLLGDIDYEQV